MRRKKERGGKGRGLLLSLFLFNRLIKMIVLDRYRDSSSSSSSVNSTISGATIVIVIY